jgi:hypothetical protein
LGKCRGWRTASTLKIACRTRQARELGPFSLAKIVSWD